MLWTLNPGLDERLYERALVIELTKQGLICEAQKQHPVHYDEQLIGNLIPDLIVNGTVIVDTKVVTAFNDSHLAQMLGYLNITGLRTALLLNFKHARLQIKRVSNLDAGLAKGKIASVQSMHSVVRKWNHRMHGMKKGT